MFNERSLFFLYFEVFNQINNVNHLLQTTLTTAYFICGLFVLFFFHVISFCLLSISFLFPFFLISIHNFQTITDQLERINKIIIIEKTQKKPENIVFLLYLSFCSLVFINKSITDQLGKNHIIK